MKKIALLTWFSNGNYGTVTQAYALRNVLSEFGECSIIPYISQYHIKALSANEAERKKAVAMKSFFFEYLDIKYSTSDKEIFKYLENKYDCFVCGGDQMWNPNHYDPVFFLNFVKNKRKISYAPSFGVSSLKGFDNIVPDIRNMLLDFNYISVREESGKDIIKRLINKEVQVCLDPTLLLIDEQWNDFASMSNLTVPTEYIYCLFLGDYRQHSSSIDEISASLQIPVLHHTYNPSDYFSKYIKVSGLSPLDFVRTIKESAFVCTDSFHATVFALILHKPFVCFRRFSDMDKKSENTRVENLLTTVGFMERLDMVSRIRSSLLDISFEESNGIIGELRKKSKDYLYKALCE